jgi:hypothetical protein
MSGSYSGFARGWISREPSTSRRDLFGKSRTIRNLRLEPIRGIAFADEPPRRRSRPPEH